MKLAEYQDAIEILAATSPATPDSNGLFPMSPAVEASNRLAGISRCIRLIAWSPMYRNEARRLTDLADTHGARLARESADFGCERFSINDGERIRA